MLENEKKPLTPAEQGARDALIKSVEAFEKNQRSTSSTTAMAKMLIETMGSAMDFDKNATKEFCEILAEVAQKTDEWADRARAIILKYHR